jgi:tRNA G18 (ribose-2'-O)-methylase SpoU
MSEKSEKSEKSKESFSAKLSKEERSRIYGTGVRKFWASMTPEEKKIYCKKRAQTFKKTLAAMTPEEMKARMAKSAGKGRDKKLSTPEGKAAHIAVSKKNLEKINNRVIRDLPRINNYAGVITMSQMKELQE